MVDHAIHVTALRHAGDCPDCSMISDDSVPVVDASSSSNELVSLIRKIEGDTTLTDHEKAKKRQQLLSGSLKSSDLDDDEMKKKSGGRNDMMKILDDKLNCSFCMQLPDRPVTVLKFFGLKSRKVNYTRVKEIFFQLPPQNQIVLYCDGASRGNPGVSGYGFIGRRHTRELLIAFSEGLGISTNYVAEVLAILNAGEWAISEGHLEVIFRTDSTVVMLSFMKNKVSWFAENR
ncbi:uncharacterized protein LOC113352438 [Papaver somniferum]|uniref:uncharacterized protein LOC113352438 n=1 Tax=Papaver somniferum TaxID=3469 RepID=UPI000E6F5D0E|nr:uncharacterized protein LOC113352438 [Papaver somniferum]